MRSLWICLLLLVAIHAKGSDSLMFHLFTGNLSQSTITGIEQDIHGFMWFSTRHGLNKYDGRVTKVFYSIDSDTSTLGDNYIGSMSQDNHGNLWVACDASGISVVNCTTGEVSRIEHDKHDPNTLSSNFVTAIFHDRNGMVWIGTEDAGICKYDPITKKVERYRANSDDPFSLSTNGVNDLLEDDNGNIWIATWHSGLNLFDPNTKRFIHYNKQVSSALKSNVVRVLHKGKENIWVGTAKGICRLSYSQGKYELSPLFSEPSEALSQLSDLMVLSILEDSEGHLWVGTENGGLFLIDLENESIRQYISSPNEESDLGSNSIWSLYQDAPGNIWIGTFNKGLYMVDRHHTWFRHVRSNPNKKNALSYDVVSSFAEDKSGNLWIGTDGGGLNYLDEKTGEYTYHIQDENDAKSLPSNAVLSIQIDHDEAVWLGMWGGGVRVKKKGEKYFEEVIIESVESQMPMNSNAIYLMLDQKGNVWISLFRDGIAVYDKTKDRSILLLPDPNDPLSITSTKNRSLFQSSDGAVWIATAGNGVDRIEVDQDYQIISKKNYSSNETIDGALSQNLVNIVFEDDLGRIWVGTNGGLNLFDQQTETFQTFTVKDGLPDNVINAMEQDHDRLLWVSTNNGLCRIDLETMEFHSYGLLDGTQGAEFYVAASFLKSDGELLFGGAHGFNRFHPQSIKRNTEVPSVYITSFEVKNSDRHHYDRVITPDLFNENQITLAHDESDFEFKIAVLNYSQPEKNRFAYILEDYDEDWIYVSNPERIIYTNVPPGDYRFRVKGSNNDDIWNKEGAEVALRIKVPWWASWWAFIFYFLVVMAILFWARRLIINQERIKNDYKIEHLELTKMQEMSEIKSRFFANISHEFRTPLTLILSPLKSLTTKTYKGDPANQFSVMQRNAERLLRLVNQLLDLSKLESGSMKLEAVESDIVHFIKPLAYSFTSYAEKQLIDYQCIFPKGPIQIYFEKEKFEKVVFNLLSNAFKYTPEFGKITFKVEKDIRGVTISVQDTGVGISEKQIKYIFNRFYQVNNKNQKGTGIGLALTKELVELHKGSIEVASEINKGSVFTVQLPSGTSHLSEDQILENTVEYELRRESFAEFDADFEMGRDGLKELPKKEPEEIEDLPIILVAEDNDELRAFICDHLITNYRVIEAINGEKAYSLAQDQIPDLIISDIMMPEMDGYELCERLKTDEKTSHIPVLLLTAKASQESLVKGFELGADHYITKPFNPKLLELRVKNVLKTRDQLKNRLFHEKLISLEPKEVVIASKDEEFLKKVMDCIEDNMSNCEFGVDDLCQALGHSRTQLFRKLKALVGQSANKFIRSIRLKRAAMLLEKSDLNISEVTYQVGFNDLHYFRYCFKKQFGVNPSEYTQKKA